MNKDRIDAKLKAKETIRGQWFYLTCTLILVGLVCGLPSGIFSGISELFDGGARYALSALGSLVSIAIVIFSLPVSAGIERKFLLVARGEERKSISVLYYYKEHDWVEKIKAYLLSGVFIVLGTLLFVVPGIILAMRYSVLGFIFADNPKITYREALNKCKEFTYGRKWEIFVLEISFLGWHLLACLTFGILEIWVKPYEETTFATWYDMMLPKPEPVEPAPIIF